MTTRVAKGLGVDRDGGSIHMAFADDGKNEPNAITAVDINVGKMVGSVREIETVFQRRQVEPLHVRVYEAVQLRLEALYVHHLRPPEPIDEDDDEEDRLETERDNRYRQRNRFGIIILPIVIVLAGLGSDSTRTEMSAWLGQISQTLMAWTAALGGQARSVIGALLEACHMYMYLGLLLTAKDRRFAPPPPPPPARVVAPVGLVTSVLVLLLLGALLFGCCFGAVGGGEEEEEDRRRPAAPPPPAAVRTPARAPTPNKRRPSPAPPSRGPSPSPARQRGDDGWMMNLRDGKQFRA